MADVRGREEQGGKPAPQSTGGGSRRTLVLTGGLVVLSLAIAAVGFSFFPGLFARGAAAARRDGAVAPAGTAVQIDVLNGCGSSGAASAVTGYLRKRGYDVVEVRNYRSLDVEETFVIDRVGDRETARGVADALGARPDRVLQQLNADYYVDVTVVVGRDFHSLKLSHEETPP